MEHMDSFNKLHQHNMERDNVEIFAWISGQACSYMADIQCMYL